MHVKSGDKVKVLTGVDKNREGVVRKVIPDEQRAIVEDVNYHYKTVRKSQDQPKGGIIEKEMPIHVSNLKVVCPNCGEATRVGRRESPYGNNARYCKQCDEFIDLVE